MSEQLLKDILSTVKSLEGTVTSLEGTVKSVEGTVTSLEEKVKSLEGTVKSLDKRVENLEIEVKGIRVEVEGTKVEVKGIREEHGTLLRALEERTSVTNATVTRLAEDMDHLKGDVARIVKRLDDHDVEIKVIKKAVAN